MANNHPVRYRCTSNEVRRQLIDAFESENIDYLELAEDLGIKREGRHDKIARGGATHSKMDLIQQAARMSVDVITPEKCNQWFRHMQVHMPRCSKMLQIMYI